MVRAVRAHPSQQITSLSARHIEVAVARDILIVVSLQPGGSGWKWLGVVDPQSLQMLGGGLYATC